MGKLELDLPNYVVAKLKKGARKKENGPYFLYYWQPKRDLRQAGFKSVALGRDLSKVMEKAKSLNEDVKIWRSGGTPDPGLPPKLGGTIPYLIDIYQDSEDYRDKAPKTRIGYDRCLEVLRKWSARAGHPMVATITRRSLRELHKSLRWPGGEPCGHAEGCSLGKVCRVSGNTPCPTEQLPNANAVMRVASILLGVALDEGLVTVNFGKGLKLPGVGGRDQVWPDEAIEAFCVTAIAIDRRSMALAVRMGADFGQREGDILKMHRGQRRENVMLIRPQKTRRRTNRAIEVPILPELAQMLDETPKDATVYIINEETGGPYKPDNFRHLFAEIRAKAGIDQIAREHGIEGGLLYMDLRRTAIVHLARAGSSVPEIAAVTGHSITRTAPVTGAAGLCQLPTSGEPPRTTQSAP